MRVVFILGMFIGLSLSSFRSDAQDTIRSFPKYKLSLNINKGFVIAIYEHISNLASHTTALELNFIKETSGQWYWERLYHKPMVGFTFLYQDFGKPGITGQAFGIIPFMQKPFIHSANFSLDVRLGFGLAYFNTIYNVHTNYKNRAISSRINGAVELNLIAHQRFGQNTDAFIGLGVNHFSNAAITVPNSGLNIPSLQLGVDHTIFSDRRPQKIKCNYQFCSDFFANFSAGIGSKQNGIFNKRRYFPSVISAEAGRHIAPKSKIAMGLDLYRDATIHSVHYNEKGLNGDSLFQVGIKLQHELVVGKASLITAIAIYAFSQSPIDGLYYQKVGLKYHFTSYLFGSVTMKTHFANADFFEWALGYTFRQKNETHVHEAR